MDLRRLLLAIATLTFAISCSSTTAPTETDASTDAGTDSGEDPDSAPTGDCKTVTNVSDGPTTDEVIAAGATTFICYYAQPSEGYHNRPDANAKSLRDGWYFTGDTCYVDADGEGRGL